MAMKRECGACQGHGLLPFETASFGVCYTSCQVCNGSGSTTDSMPISDALADAETLRLAAIDEDRETRAPLINAYLWEKTGLDARSVRVSARNAFVACPELRS